METLEFDYVIVGAGSAGCVLADRLSSCGRFSVLLLESGGTDTRLWVKIPIGYAFNVNNPAVNWGYKTDPDAGLNARSISWPRGRLIGGSSSINAMAYMRGLPSDFEDWEAAGATGWNWRSVRSVFERLETQCEISGNGIETKGTGPVWVSELTDQMSPFSDNFLSAAQDLGHGITRDLNQPNVDGLGFYRSTVRNGVRWSAADAFLKPAQTRSNLKVMRSTNVDRLLSDGAKVTGVACQTRGKTLSIFARKEVILSAGAVNSPKLLQLSGFGPAELLKRYGIRVKHHLPQVGRGLQDHLAISYQFLSRTRTLNHTLGRFIGKANAGLKYSLTRRGALSVPVNQVGGFVRSDAKIATPDLQLYFNPISYSVSALGKTIVGRPSGYQISAQPCRPTSTGAIEIASAAPQQNPKIMPNSLSTEEDRAKALAGSKMLQKYALSDSLKRVTKQAKSPDLLALDDEALLEDFRNRASTVFHPTCTCRMGNGAEDSVLDSRLRVHGVKNLRVVDASAFPNITSGNTNAPTMMLALRAADLILEDAL